MLRGRLLLGLIHSPYKGCNQPRPPPIAHPIKVANCNFPQRPPYSAIPDQGPFSPGRVMLRTSAGLSACVSLPPSRIAIQSGGIRPPSSWPLSRHAGMHSAATAACSLLWQPWPTQRLVGNFQPPSLERPQRPPLPTSPGMVRFSGVIFSRALTEGVAFLTVLILTSTTSASIASATATII